MTGQVETIFRTKDEARGQRSPATITIAICTYDRYDLLPKAIKSALAQSAPDPTYKVLVVDNSPDQEAAKAFSRRYLDDRRIEYLLEPTPGLSNARNVAAQHCGTEFIAFMDDDAIAEPGWVTELLAGYAAFGSETAIVGGRVDAIWGAHRPLWLSDKLLGNLSVVNWGGSDARRVAPQEWLVGTNISYRTHAILDCGGFPTNLGRIGAGETLLSNEESALTEQIAKSGAHVVYAPKAVVGHLAEPGRLTRNWFRKRAAWQATSDFTMDPKRFAEAARDYMPKIAAYFSRLPPHDRTVRGFTYETDSPELFEHQLGAIYMFTMVSLNGFDGAVP